MSALELVIGNKNYSSWSLRPWVALKAAGIPFSETVVPLFRPGYKEEILRHSPAGKVPVLKDGGVMVWESLAILEYLAERFPDARLWPQEAAARAWARAVANEMHAGFMALRRNMPMNVRKSLPGRGRAEGVAQDIARIQAIWAECREAFAGAGPFLFGPFSNADAMFAPVVFRFATYEVELEPACAAYRQAMLGLPAMQQWQAAARAESWVIEAEELA